MAEEKKQILLDDREFCHFTGYGISHYNDLDKAGLIHKEKKLIDIEKSLYLILDKLNKNQKLSRKKILKLIERVDEYRGPIVPKRINKTQFSYMLDLTCKDNIDKYLSKFEDAPKPITEKKEKMYDLKECKEFIEKRRIFKFSNRMAQDFVQRPYVRNVEVRTQKVRVFK